MTMRKRVILTLFIGATIALPSLAVSQIVTLSDTEGDATLRRMDLDADGPFDLQSQAVPDLLSIELVDFAPTAPHVDRFVGTANVNGGFIRIDVVFAGLVNPPGTLGYDNEPYAPDAYGPNPIVGYIEIDIDGNENTGGEFEDVRYRYLGNVARFGGLPSEPRFQNRAASMRDDINGNLFSAPYVEKSGEEFHIALIDEDVDDIDVIVENPSGNASTFDAGEVWQIRGDFFHRAHAYDEFTYMCQSGNDRYEPTVWIQFAHDSSTDRTTLSLVIPKTNADAAKFSSPSQQAQQNDGCDFNQYSILEAVTDMQFSATVADPFTRMLPEFQLIADWEYQSTAPALDIANWRVAACVGTAYLPDPVDGEEIIWTDIYPNVLAGDVNGDGVVDEADQADIDQFIDTFDGTAFYDDDGDAQNGSIDWYDWGANFCVFDVNYDGFIDGMELNTSIVGDLNLDGVVNGFDIQAFILGVLDRAGYESLYPSADIDVIGDTNGDNIFSIEDMDSFTTLLMAS